MNKEPMYQKILRDLYNSIENNKYGIGDKLPSENELSEMYGVSRITSKRALEIMADRGYVMRQPGKGTFVIKNPGSSDPGDPDGVYDADSAGDNGEKKTIGVIMDSFGVSFGPELIRAFEYECHRRGYLMMLCFSYGSMEAETEALNKMRNTGAAGVLMICAQGETYNSEILKAHFGNFPIVLVDRSMQGIPIPVVTTDNFNATRELMDSLLAKGHTRICFLSHSSIQTTTVAERFNAYLTSMSLKGLITDETLWVRDLDSSLPADEDETKRVEYAREHIRNYVDNHPDVTAFFAVEFSIAVMLYEVLKEKGLQDEKDIVYFDGFEGGLGLDHRFTHVMQNQYQMGVTAVRMLVHMLRGEEVPQKELIPYTIITE